jgi:hypothetical protein
MSKKGHRQIPDFSRKRPVKGTPGAIPEEPGTKPPAPPPVRTTKPPATSMKSGRRGQ